jgi:hypothetical protein
LRKIQDLNFWDATFCNMHELSCETKATGKEQYHNNFGCYDFVPRSDVCYPVPTFRKRWPGALIQEWFYVKNNLVEREDIKGSFNALSGLASALGGQPLPLEMIFKHVRWPLTLYALILAQGT